LTPAARRENFPHEPLKEVRGSVIKPVEKFEVALLRDSKYLWKQLALLPQGLCHAVKRYTASHWLVGATELSKIDGQVAWALEGFPRNHYQLSRRSDSGESPNLLASLVKIGPRQRARISIGGLAGGCQWVMAGFLGKRPRRLQRPVLEWRG
jgi:hypothetical protein